MKRSSPRLDAGDRPKVAVGYVRVSTKKQEDDGLSIQTQEDRIRAWATLQGYELLGIYGDGKSGKNTDRPGFQRAIALACERKAAFVCCKFDRFARSTTDAIATCDQLRDGGADFVSLAESIDTTSAMGRFFFRMVASLAELERERIVERTLEVLDGKRERGEALGNTPFGWKSTGRRGMLVVDEGEQRTLRSMLEHYKASNSLAYTVRKLNAAGLLTRSGTPWTKTSVRRIVRKPRLAQESADLVLSA
jgi:site-specific DNA recombinase